MTRARLLLRAWGALVSLGACGKSVPSPTQSQQGTLVDAALVDHDVTEGATLDAEIDGGEPEPFVDAGDAERALYLGASAPCAKGDTADGRVRCMLAHKYQSDPQAMSIALDLFKDTGDVVGLEAEQTFDGGFRGQIHIVPELPLGDQRKHLEALAAAMRDFDDLFAKARAKKPATLRYRWRAILYRFFRSVGRTTPSAYANGWVVSINVSGSLLQNETGMRETLFHELFHSNDHAHGGWSGAALRATFDAIVKRCGTNMACLAPYAPSDTVVRGGTYYAFQPDNGDAVREYAAELALRWYKEHRAILRGEKPAKKAFKCGPAENAKTWSLLVEEFFGGIDLVPPCE